MILQIKNALETSSDYILKMKELGFEYIPRLIGAIIVYLVGSFAVKWICNLLGKVLEAKQVDISLHSFLNSLVKSLLTILLLLTVLGMLGVNLTSFAAILAGLAVGIGAALNGTLGNFAGGVMMLLFKPFKVGDLIEAQAQIGTVIEQGIFNTILLSGENKTIILANGPLSTGTIINFSTHGSLRVDTTIAIDQSVNIESARAVATKTMLDLPNVLKTPSPEVKVLKVGDGMTVLAIRPYCKQEHYWEVFFGVQEAVKNAFDANKIESPKPHSIFINKN